MGLTTSMVDGVCCVQQAHSGTGCHVHDTPCARRPDRYAIPQHWRGVPPDHHPPAARPPPRRLRQERVDRDADQPVKVARAHIIPHAHAHSGQQNVVRIAARYAARE
jgi:hypothetical protein